MLRSKKTRRFENFEDLEVDGRIISKWTLEK
jgi:hypothetical protein